MRRMRHIKAREFQGCDLAYDFSNQSSLYDATSGGSLVAANGAIARAEDLSGNSAHMTQGTSNSRPLRKAAYLNGVDCASFDGSNDFMTAGDVADILDKSLTVLFVGRNTSTANYSGYFGKSRAGAGAGRWTILKNVDAGGDVNAAVETSVIASITLAKSTADRIYVMKNVRAAGTNASTLEFKNNVGGSSSASYTDNLASSNNVYSVFLGSYQDSTGTANFSGTELAGVIGEACKWSRALSAHEVKRLMNSRARKWRLPA